MRSFMRYSIAGLASPVIIAWAWVAISEAQPSQSEEAVLLKRLVEEIDGLKSQIVPKGAVVAFDFDIKTDPGCPSGWDFYEPAGGRTIVGAGDHSNKWFHSGSKLAVPLSIYPTYAQDIRAGLSETADARATGGEEMHKLAVDEMPSHNHSISTGYGKNWHNGLAGGEYEGGIDVEFLHDDSSIKRDGGHGILSNVIDYRGGGIPHNNMQPFIALYYCKKI